MLKATHRPLWRKGMASLATLFRDDPRFTDLLLRMNLEP